ncbi:hypothetical protein ABW20_dc0102785 [Dactylellina cionopaga]|nr:hypothetical protein ABW20_dc0102785 [Dactylellina cionopaga]
MAYQHTITYQQNYGSQLPQQSGLFDKNSDYTCDVCKSDYFSGALYHCTTCQNGDFDMCEPCRFQGRTCFCGQNSNGIVRLKIIPGKGRRYLTSESSADGVDSEDLAVIPFPELLPADISIKDHLENPELLPYYQRLQVYRDTHKNPPYNTHLCCSAAEYDDWENESYKPQQTFYEEKVAHFNNLLKDAVQFTKYSARSGMRGWEHQTSDGEVVDCLDLIMHIMLRIEETYEDLSNLTDEMNKQWTAKEIYVARSTGNQQHVTSCEEWFTAIIREERETFYKARYERISETLKDMEAVVRKAHAIEKFAFDALLAKVTIEVEAVKSGANSQLSYHERTKVVKVLEKHHDIRQKLEGRLFNFRKVHIKGYLDQRLAEYSVDEATVRAECDNLLSSATSAKVDAVKNITEEYDFKVSRTLLPTLSSVPTAAPPPLYSSSTAGVTPNVHPQPSTHRVDNGNPNLSIGQPVQSNMQSPGTAPAANPPRFQMPLSYYSNMLTQQHAVNMNVINNIAGGDTTYSVANPVTGIKYW